MKLTLPLQFLLFFSTEQHNTATAFFNFRSSCCTVFFSIFFLMVKLQSQLRPKLDTSKFIFMKNGLPQDTFS